MIQAQLQQLFCRFPSILFSFFTYYLIFIGHTYGTVFVPSHIVQSFSIKVHKTLQLALHIIGCTQNKQVFTYSGHKLNLTVFCNVYLLYLCLPEFRTVYGTHHLQQLLGCKPAVYMTCCNRKLHGQRMLCQYLSLAVHLEILPTVVHNTHQRYFA